jgi:hypothetical protein
MFEPPRRMERVLQARQTKRSQSGRSMDWHSQNITAVLQHARVQLAQNPSANSNKLNSNQTYSCLGVMGRRELNNGSSQECVSSGGNQVGTNWSDSAGFHLLPISWFNVTCDIQTSMENNRHLCQTCWLCHICSIIQSCQNRTLQILCSWIEDRAKPCFILFLSWSHTLPMFGL